MISTRLTSMFQIRHPLVLGPMGAVAGGELAAAVSNAGALGMVGGGYGDADWLRRELDIVCRLTREPWGAGLITWSAQPNTVDLILGYKPHAIMLSFGDPRPLGTHIKQAGCKLVCQVQTVADARLALEAGADLIVAQGTEGGGHGGVRATLPLVPAVLDAVAPVPVVAAGGIADGRGLAAALALGADGVLMGTRFYASAEALGHFSAKQRIAQAQGEDTVRTHVFDIVRGYDWPTGHTGRSLQNAFTRRWHGRDAELQQHIADESKAYAEASAAGNCETAVVWAGEAVDLIQHVEPAADLVERIMQEALTAVNRLASLPR